MNSRISQILEQIAALENELHAVIGQQEEHLRYQIKGQCVTFERAISEAHLKAKMSVFRWFMTVRPQNYITMPIIYGMIVPLALLDLFITFYQVTCFPIYKIARVRRASYIVLDHRHLAYLNLIEKAHCMYCSYAVGLLGYARNHGAHSRYKDFLSYGDADHLHEKVEASRDALAKEKGSGENIG